MKTWKTLTQEKLLFIDSVIQPETLNTVFKIRKSFIGYKNKIFIGYKSKNQG